MRSVDIEAAEADFLSLLEDVERGEEVVITRAGKPVAKLVSSEQPVRRRQLSKLGSSTNVRGWVVDLRGHDHDETDGDLGRRHDVDRASGARQEQAA
jgi:prevent-host-death family protein